jgi:ribosome-associated translation inhibitor RaiA
MCPQVIFNYINKINQEEYVMQIQVNTDHNVKGGDLLIKYVEGLLNDALNSFKDEVTRVEVYVSDENSHKGGDDDLRCTMEARIRGLQPIAVTHHDDNVDQAIAGATDRITRSVRKTIEKRREVKHVQSRLNTDEEE